MWEIEEAKKLKIKNCREGIKGYLKDLIEMIDNNYPEDAYNECLKIIDVAKCETRGNHYNQSIYINLNNKEIECDLENAQTRKELKAFVEYELNKYKDDNIKLKAFKDTDAIFNSEVSDIVSQIIDKEDIECKGFSVKDINVDLIIKDVIKKEEMMCEIKIIVEKFKDKVFKRFDLKGDDEAKIVELIKNTTLKYLPEFVEKKISFLKREEEKLQYEIKESQRKKLTEDNKSKLKIVIKTELDLLDKDSFESTEYFSITKDDLACSLNDKIDLLCEREEREYNLDTICTKDEISKIALKFIKEKLNTYDYYHYRVNNIEEDIQNKITGDIGENRKHKQLYKEFDLKEACSYILNNASFSTIRINNVDYTIYDNSHENNTSIIKTFTDYINNLEKEDEKSTDSEVIAFVINKEFLNNISRYTKYDNLDKDNLEEIETLFKSKLTDKKYNQFLDDPILLQDKYPRTALLLKEYKKFKSIGVIANDTYNGPFLENNCADSFSTNDNLQYCAYKGVLLFEENSKLKMYDIKSAEIVKTTEKKLYDDLFFNYDIITPKVITFSQYLKNLLSHNDNDEPEIWEGGNFEDFDNDNSYYKLPPKSYDLVNFTDKKFNPSANARFYVDSKSEKNVINTFEDISNLESLECEDTEYPTINKVIEHIFKGNNEAIIIFYTVLSSFIKNRVAPDFWLIFKVKDTFGLGFELIYRTIILPIFKAKQCLLLEGTELYGKLTKDIFENIIIFINNLPTGITKTQKKQLDKNVAFLRNDSKQYNLMFVKTTETTALNIKRDPNSYQVFDINSDVNENNFLGFQTEKKLERAIENELPAFIKMLHNLNVDGNIKDIDSIDNEIRNICITSGTRIDVHLEAYLTKNLSVFEPLTKATNAKDRELFEEIKKNFNHKKPFVSQQLISKVWIALEQDSKSTSDILDRFKATDTLFFGSVKNSQKMSNSDVRYFINSEYNKYFENNS